MQSPTAAFDEKGVFTPNNWNDARIGLIRMFFDDWSSNSIRNETVWINDLKVTHRWEDDNNYVTITDRKTGDVYGITWYKSRGRTSMIFFNNQRITLERYKTLLQLLLQSIRS